MSRRLHGLVVCGEDTMCDAAERRNEHTGRKTFV